jgi:CheY-like chemotaxis protein
VDGLQFLQLLHQVCPDPRKVVMSSHSEEHYRQECLQRGAVLFLKKPASVEGFESIFRVLHEILQWQPPRGFSGLLRNVTISDLVQLECISRASSILQITTSTICGRIYINAGRIAHAETQDKQGEEAFLDLVSLETGAFAVQPYGEPPRHSIDESCDGLLLAAAQRCDERAHQSESSMETDTSLSKILQKSSNFPDNLSSARRSKSTSTCYSGAC